MARKPSGVTTNFPPKSSMDYAKEEYQRGYGFNKRVSVRSPVQSSYQERYIREDKYGMHTRKEKNMVVGASHGFSGRRDGSVYTKPNKNKIPKGKNGL